MLEGNKYFGEKKKQSSVGGIGCGEEGLGRMHWEGDILQKIEEVRKLVMSL